MSSVTLGTPLTRCLLTLLLLWSPTSTRAQTSAPPRIAAINFQRAVEGTSDFMRAAQQWTEAMRAQTADLEVLQEEISEAEARLTEGRETLSVTERETLIARIEERRADYDRMAADVQRDLNALREQLLLPITAKVDAAVREYATENDIALIFDVSNPQSGIVVSSATIDITDAVIEAVESADASDAAP